MKAILALGATSGIIFEVLRALVEKNPNLVVVMAARDEAKLKPLASDLLARGAQAVHTLAADLSKDVAPKFVYEKARELADSIDTVLIGYGILPDQARSNAEHRRESLAVNFSSQLEHSMIWFDHFKEYKTVGASISVIGSVAGDRGRRSNFIYGAQKAALDAALSGLRSAGQSLGIQVTTIKPGFIDSPMTAHLKKNALFTSAEKAGSLIAAGIKDRVDVLYVPGYWRLIMWVIRLIPEAIFKRLAL